MWFVFVLFRTIIFCYICVFFSDSFASFLCKQRKSVRFSLWRVLGFSHVFLFSLSLFGSFWLWFIVINVWNNRVELSYLVLSLALHRNKWMALLLLLCCLLWEKSRSVFPLNKCYSLFSLALFFPFLFFSTFYSARGRSSKDNINKCTYLTESLFTLYERARRVAVVIIMQSASQLFALMFLCVN